MLDRFDKCNYCQYYDEYENDCSNFGDDTYYKDHCFRADKEKLLAASKEIGVSVMDLIRLIEL